ncbi:GATOR complex protein NPRL2-like [Bradysia coprophila]|uniref:GATOR complex protein NPRL2-like n=1 Tax=Bradysia coprophila TaxID=38358 RepID=UPI00187D84D0|nr:GATOR complex protein NPRL2-like [Bradysia coprophila]XP_037043332.1 GATOR complex protein NPRL2-like [Bradysia coprophila]
MDQISNHNGVESSEEQILQNGLSEDDDYKYEPYNDNDVDDPEPVKCIFLCEFHPTAGPKISCQEPADFISKELFKTVSRYIIPKIQLQRSFLSVSLLGKKILGYPVRIDNKQYTRNAFYFNFCFVFAPTTRTVVYEPVVRKLTEYMLTMELSTKILSQINDAAQVTRLTRLLAQIRRDINRKRMCMLQEGSTIIPLCVVPHYPEQPAVYPHSAVILNSKFHKYVQTQWDLTTLRILPYINGFNHISRISAMADVAQGLVIDCVKHLVLLGVAVIVPVFQYSNVYRPTPKLSQLAKCHLLQERCIERCSKSNLRQAKVRDIFRIFASMAHGATFGELCVRFNPAALNISEKQMVLFGLLEGLIRRVDRYPITVSRNLFYDDEDALAFLNKKPIAPGPIDTFDPLFATDAPPPKDRVSHPLPRGNNKRQQCNGNNGTGNQQLCIYNGLKSLDEICCTRGISSGQLEMQLAKDRHVIVLLK